MYQAALQSRSGTTNQLIVWVPSTRFVYSQPLSRVLVGGRYLHIKL